jgi:hypothetical protein
MAEWLKAPVLKTDEDKTSGGSNPSFSVRFHLIYKINDIINQMKYMRFFFFIVSFSFYNVGDSEKYNMLLIHEFFLNKKNISQIKKTYEKEIKKELDMKEFYEDLELIIYIYYILKNNFTESIFQELLKDIESPNELNNQESFLFKMLMKKNNLCEIIFKNIKIDSFYEKNEDYEDDEIYVSSLVAEGKFKKKIPIIDVFNEINSCIFSSDIKNFEKQYGLAELKVHYKKSKKPLKNKIDGKNKTFRIVLNSYNILPVIYHHFDLFTFDNPTEAKKNLSILKENPSMDMELFKKYLINNKIKYEYADMSITNEQLTFEMNHLLENKNIKDKFIIDNRVFFIKSKKYLRKNLRKFQLTNEEIYEIVKNNLLNFMKNYKDLIKFLEEAYSK